MRITNADRDGIINQELKNRFYDSIKDIDAKYHIEINKAIKKTISKKISDFNEKNPGWLALSNNYSFRDKEFDNLAKREAKFNRYVSSYYPIEKNSWEHVIDKTSPIEKLVTKKYDLLLMQDQYKKELRQLLYCYTTDKKLIEAVPELSKYFTQGKVAHNSVVPASLIKNVRKHLRDNTLDIKE